MPFPWLFTIRETHQSFPRDAQRCFISHCQSEETPTSVHAAALELFTWPSAFSHSAYISLVLFCILTIPATVIIVALLFAGEWGRVRSCHVGQCGHQYLPDSAFQALWFQVCLTMPNFRNVANFIVHFLPAHFRCKSLERKNFDLFYWRLYL